MRYAPTAKGDPMRQLILLMALAQPAHAMTWLCSSDGGARVHGNYPANRPPCVLNADNYFNRYLETDPLTSWAPNTLTSYNGIWADFAGTGPNGNLKKLTANRVGASCSPSVGTCG